MIYAKIDDSNTVLECIVADSEFVTTLEGQWIGREETDRDCPSVGWTYRDNTFFPDKPHKNWIFEEKTWRYVPPVPYPSDGYHYVWHQPTMEWLKCEYTEDGEIVVPALL